MHVETLWLKLSIFYYINKYMFIIFISCFFNYFYTHLQCYNFYVYNFYFYLRQKAHISIFNCLI
ncbi:hypothetical protein A1OE_1271 [Candidatus Endolissoclinum faulkneri L2]|uniref:Uncharacterized protein n=1 Tax=Candidatus Endolissoclinum faulkneri L2 TaxID=1193729 RepID=K7YIM7_9PROT|nr:hypothetical protein A1OE_1271 [Candidatus Endolissoclinum faulkneri L2]